MKSFWSIILFLFVVNTYGQKDPRQLKVDFMDAEYFFMGSEYNEALPLYQKLFKSDTSNANFRFRLGICYLHTPLQKYKAIPHLEFASQHVSSNYVEGLFKEKRAPEFAWLFLGNAYRVNEKLDKAIDAYEKFIEELPPSDVFYIDLGKRLIVTCQNAKELMTKPVYFRSQDLGDKINKSGNNYHPVISGDGSTLVYSVSKKFYDAIYYARKKNGSWGRPKEITGELQEDFLYPTCLSYDGNILYTFKIGRKSSDLYVSEFLDPKWSKASKLSNQINTRSWDETHASISKDGSKLYFTSNRRGGEGGIDLYVSEFDEEENDWGTPKNLGQNINTPFDEETPFISSDGRRLFFSSQGHNSIGGFDIFYSNLESGIWGIPVNFSYPLNTTDNDIYFSPIENGDFAIVSKIDKDYATQRIFQYEIFADYHPLMIDLNVLVRLEDSLPTSSSLFEVELLNAETNELMDVQSLNEEGKYKHNIKVGGYKLKVSSPDYETKEYPFSLSYNYPNPSYNVELSLIPKAIRSITAERVDTLIQPTDSVKLDANDLIVENESDVNIPDPDPIPVVPVIVEEKEEKEEEKEKEIIEEKKPEPDLRQFTEIKQDGKKRIYIKNLFFYYNAYALSYKSKVELERIIQIMNDYPSLKLQIEGHTDSKGRKAYNKELALLRADRVYRYLTEKGVSESRLKKVSYGEERALANNQYSKGRKLNRRVELRVIDEGSSGILNENINVPEYLRVKPASWYTIYLNRSEKQIDMEQSKLKSVLPPVSSYKIDGQYVNTCGYFTQKADAVQYLNAAIDNGYANAKIMSGTDLRKVYPNISTKLIKERQKQTRYSIQIFALQKNRPVSFIKNLNGIEKLDCTDGYYRYLWGHFRSFMEAKEALQKLKRKGFKDAFIVREDKYNQLLR